MIKKIKNYKNGKHGFTLLELVVAVSLIGILLGGGFVRYSKVTRSTQKERNRANMVIIQKTFFQYFYRMHLNGNPHFPPTPLNDNTVMDSTWCSTVIDSSMALTAPNHLFANKSVPKNKITKKLVSSGTSGQEPSKIYLDKENANNQTKVLNKIMTTVIGKRRLPMLIIDQNPVIKNRSTFNARAAAIYGFSIFGTNHT